YAKLIAFAEITDIYAKLCDLEDNYITNQNISALKKAADFQRIEE
ncbi:8906_t:CDS:1, partial [Scutellospora calospora]